MKKNVISFIVFLFVLTGFLVVATSVDAASRVRGYYKPKSGSYVQPHYRSSPNRSTFDNWSTKGNYNPYTGKIGTKDPFKSSFKWRW